MIDDGALIRDRKADFTGIYNQPDPRAYFRTLNGLDYQVPQQALPVFEAVLAASVRARRPRTILDVCCSYGINAALLRCEVGLNEIAARCTDPALAGLPPDELIKADEGFYARRLRRPEVTVLGLDVAAPAIDYAVRAGLVAGGWAEDLETSDPSSVMAAGVRDVGMIISTGGVGYVGARTFDRLLRAVGDPHDLWLAIFVLRVFGYDEIADSFARYDLVTERVTGLTFRQRRFAGREEYEAANQAVVLRGLDPTGKEATGWYHADCFLTRPAAAAAETPVAELLAGVLPLVAGVVHGGSAPPPAGPELPA
ncbi:MAG TPA: class I SAM-dependent methyltransferase [Pseudonocardiaceae bacterium]